MGRSYTEEEKAFLSQVTAPSGSGGLQIASTSLVIQNEDKRKCNNQRQLILDPTGNTLYYWLFIVTAGVIYNCWTLIFRISFFETDDDVLIWMICDYLVDFVYLLDMFAASRTGFLLEGILQNDAKQLRMHYIKTTYFYIDILSVLPFELFRISVSYDPVYRLNRLLKFYRFWYFLDRFESRTKYPNIFRLASLSQFILVAIHWNACIYFLLSRHLGFGSNQWVYPGIEGKINLTASYSSMTRKYIYSFYWSTLTLTTIGVPHPNNNIGYVFVTIDYLIGVLLFATIVGNVGNIVSNTKMARVKFQSQMDKLKKYMYAHKTPKRLNEHVIKWFDYLWTSKQHADDEGVLAALPHKLRAEIAIHVHLDSLKKVAIFQNCEAGFLCELVLKLKPQLISPGDFVCHKGEVGREMYIVNRGKLEVVSDDGCNVLCTLQAGSYFGEISILDLGGRDGNRRTASVRSVGYSDLFQLSKQDLIEVLKDYPEVKGKIEKNAREKLERDRKRKISTKNDRPDLELRECYQKTAEELTMQIDILKRSNAELAQELFHVKCVYDERIANLESALGVLLRKRRNESNSRS